MTEAAHHDFQPELKVTPVGILLPQSDELFMYRVASRVTSDCLVDRIEVWWSEVGEGFSYSRRLLLNLDNGPENHSRWTQFIQQLVSFVDKIRLTVELAYYPPYHSKHNPTERYWGVLEQHWNWSVLDELQVALDFIESMTWRGVHPVVMAVTKLYYTRVTLSKEAMAALEQRLSRDPLLGRLFVTIARRNVSG